MEELGRDGRKGKETGMKEQERLNGGETVLWLLEINAPVIILKNIVCLFDTSKHKNQN